MILWKFVLRCVVSDMADGMCTQVPISNGVCVSQLYRMQSGEWVWKKDVNSDDRHTAPIKYSRTPGRFLGIDTEFSSFSLFLSLFSNSNLPTTSYMIHWWFVWPGVIRIPVQKQHHFAGYIGICTIHVTAKMFSFQFSNGKKVVDRKKNWEKSWIRSWSILVFRFFILIPSCNCCYISYDILCLTNDHSK